MNNIRRFKLDELDDIMKIWLETNKQAHHFIDGAYWDSMFDAVKEMLPQSTIYVYEVNEQLQGFIGIIDQDIAGIFITQHNQSQGIGKKLLQYAKEKYDTLTLQVYEKNSRAVQFYKREGFVITKEQLDEETGQLEYVMAWGNEVRSDSNSAVQTAWETGRRQMLDARRQVRNEDISRYFTNYSIFPKLRKIYMLISMNSARKQLL